MWLVRLLVAVLVLVMSAASHGRTGAVDVRTFHSPNGQFTAVVASPRQGGYEEPSTVTLYGPSGERTVYPLFKGFPETVLLLDDGRLVTVGRRGYFWPETIPDTHLELIAVFDAAGKALFAADLRDLRLVAPAMTFPLVTDISPPWYREATVSADGTLLKIVLADIDELHLPLDTFVLAHLPIPTEQIHDPEKLLSRADAYRDTPAGVAILENIVERFPGDAAAVFRLRRHRSGEGDHAGAISLLRRLAQEHPLDAPIPTVRYPGDATVDYSFPYPPNVRMDLAEEYLLAGQPKLALAVLDEVRVHVDPHKGLDLLEIDTLLSLDRVEEAHAVVERMVKREQRYSAFRSDFEELISLYAKHGHRDGIESVVGMLDTSTSVYLELLEEYIDFLVHNGRETAAKVRLEELMHSGNRTHAATVLGRIHANDAGDIPMDLSRARYWFEFAVESPYARLPASSSDVDAAIRELCQINLVLRSEGRLDEAAKWCGELSGRDTAGTLWRAIVLLDPDFDGRNVEEGLRLLESANCPPGGWAGAHRYYGVEYATNLNRWVARTLERNLGTDNATVQFCLGRLYDAWMNSEVSPASRRDGALDLFAKAGAQDHVEALMALARLKKTEPCDEACWEEVSGIYERAAGLGEKRAYYYLAEITLDRGRDTDLDAAEGYLARFSDLARKDDLDPQGYCGFRLFRDQGHAVESLYAKLEDRLGRKVDRVPDRVCP